MQTFPLASVIIPSYNSPDIYATLDSVLMQDYPRIQLILIDDCSAQFPKEEVTAYIARHSGENLVRWQVLVNPENLGTVRTMNTALGLCEGDYIFNLASDDCFYDERVLSDWVAEFIRTGAPVITAYRKLYDSLLQTPLHIEPSPEQVCAIQSDTICEDSTNNCNNTDDGMFRTLIRLSVESSKPFSSTILVLMCPTSLHLLLSVYCKSTPCCFLFSCS